MTREEQRRAAEAQREGEDAHAREVPVVEGPVEDRPASEEVEAEVPSERTHLSPAHAALDALPKEELIDRHLRLVADLRRLRQRAQEEERDARRHERERVLLAFFDVLDNFERGLDGKEDDNPWAEGMRGIHKQMLDVLSRFGVTPFAPFGEPFDAEEHEALTTMPDPDKPDGTVAFVERNGYREDQRVLRPARVVVVKNA